MITTILYDVDQTLINSPWHNFTNTYTKEFGVLYEDMLPFFVGPLKKCQTGKADMKVELLPYLSKWKWKGSVEELLTYWFTAENSIDARLLWHIRELRKKGIRCYVATNNEPYRTGYLWETLDLQSEFEDIFASGAVGFFKNQPEFWANVLRKVEGKKETTLLWDNDPENVEVAAKFGLKAEVYTDFDTYKNKTEALTSSQR